jgi:hypothetical protein
MQSNLEQAKQQVALWVQNHPRAILYDQESALMVDVTSGKNLRLPWHDLKAFEEKCHPETKDAYVVLLFENGTQIALVDPGGIAFAPSTQNTGPVANLPPVVCLKDYDTLKGRVDHYLYDHPDQPPPRECLELVMLCLATLDGARAVGFDVGDLEGELDKLLREIERRTG